MKLRIFTNKKGGILFDLAKWLIAIAILVFIAFMIYAVRKGMISNITEIFKRW